MTSLHCRLQAIGALVALVVAASSHCALVAQGEPATGRALLERHIAWRLVDKAARLECITATGTITSSIGTGSRRLALASDGRMREDTTIAGGWTSIGRDAKGHWANESGSTMTLSPVEGQCWAEAQERNWRMLWPADVLDCATVGTEAVDGVDGTVVVCPAANGWPIAMVLGPNGELLASRTISHGVPRITRYSDWRVVSGVRMPGREVVRGNVEGTLVWDSIEVRSSIDEVSVERPGLVGRAHFDGGLAQTTVPLSTSRGLLFVSIAVAGESMRAFVDSGCAQTMFDRDMADKLGMVQGTGGRVQLIDELLPTRQGKETTIEIGTARWSALPCIADLSRLDAGRHEDFDAVLGSNLLSAFAVCFDQQAGSLTLSDPEKLTVPSNATVVRAFASRYGHAVIQARVEDLAEEWFLLDTGSTLPVILCSPFVARANLLAGRPAVRDTEWQGGKPIKVGRLRSLRFGAEIQRDVGTAFAMDRQGILAMTEYAGILGGETLRRFRVTFDLRNDRLILEPRGADRPR